MAKISGLALDRCRNFSAYVRALTGFHHRALPSRGGPRIALVCRVWFVDFLAGCCELRIPHCGGVCNIVAGIDTLRVVAAARALLVGTRQLQFGLAGARG